MPERLAPKLPPLVAEVAIGIALPTFLALMRMALFPWLGSHSPYSLIFVAVVASTVLAGWRSGLIACAVGQSLIWLWVVEPTGKWALKNPAELQAMLLATLAQLVAVAIIAAYQREVRKAVVERERADRARELIMQELDHRVRNTLAVVQSIARQTIKPRDSAVLDAFDARLAALADAQAALASSQWDGAKVGDLVANALKPFGEDGGQVLLSGPDIAVPPRAALYLSLALHELATNAAKYGSLGSESGSVAISWTGSDDGAFELVWQESGGPPVSPPTKGGFGTKLIERGLAAELRGTVDLEFDPAGLRCVIRTPATAD